jgi:hypothetical protein
MKPTTAASLLHLSDGYHVVAGMIILLLFYNFVCIMSFAGVYSTIDFSKHFSLPAGFKNTFGLRLYYAFCVQAQCMAGEIYPITNLARGILSTQIVFAWTIMLLFIVPWVLGGAKHAAKHMSAQIAKHIAKHVTVAGS